MTHLRDLRGVIDREGAEIGALMGALYAQGYPRLAHGPMAHDAIGYGSVVLELRAADRIGLLHHVADALEQSGVDIVWARVSTLGSTVVDSFAITVPTGGPSTAGPTRSSTSCT